MSDSHYNSLDFLLLFARLYFKVFSSLHRICCTATAASVQSVLENVVRPEMQVPEQTESVSCSLVSFVCAPVPKIVLISKHLCPRDIIFMELVILNRDLPDQLDQKANLDFQVAR